MKKAALLLGILAAVHSALAAAPAITAPPQSRVLRVGDHLAFAVAASGTATLNYQWAFNGTSIGGATTTSLSLTNIQLTNTGTYTVTVTNASGTAAASATLTVSEGLLHLYPTNLVVLRAGDGVAGLATSGNTLYLDQLTTNGTYVSSVAIPDSGASSCIGFNAGVDNYLGSVSNNRAVLFGGYNVTKPFAGGSLLTATATAAPRAVGSVNGLGYFNLAVSDNNTAFDGKRLESVTSLDGTSQFWTFGSSTILITPGAPDVTLCTTPASRSAASFYSNDLYAAMSGGLFHFGSVPTSASTPTKLLSTSNPNDFAISPDGNTIYMTEGGNEYTAGGGVQRWDYDSVGAAWSRSYTFTNLPAAASGNNGPIGLAVDFSGFTAGGAAGVGAVLYATTSQASQNNLIRIVDNGSNSPVSILYTAGVNQSIHGVRFAPTADAPAITAQPASVINVPGSTVSFTVGVTGSAPFTYHWQRGGTNLLNGGNIAGADTATLTLLNVSATDAVAYKVFISNDLGTVTSDTATFTLSAADPGIAGQPQDVATNFGATVRFSVGPVGSAPLALQWQKEGVDLSDGPAPSGSGATVSGSTSSSLVIRGVTCTDSGNYSVRVSNGHGSVTSSNAVLTVQDPYIAVEPASPILAPGATATFSVSAVGSGSLSYQWSKNGTALTDGDNISGSQTATLTLTSISSANSGNYSVAVSGSGCGSNAVSTVGALTVLTPPQPRTVPAGDRVTFVLGVSSPATLVYQWALNGTDLPGATTTRYVVANAQATNAGTYSVLASNIVAGSVGSASATLTVAPGRLRLYPTNLVVLRGGDGLGALADTGVPLYLDQFTTNGEYVSTVTIPDSGRSALIGSSGLTDDYLGSAANRHAVVFGGFNVARPYGSTLTSTTSAAVPRGIGTVNGLGYYSLAVSDTNSIYNGGRMVGVTSSDGETNFWTIGGAGVVYVAPALGPDVVITNLGGRYSAQIFNGALYASLSGGLYQFNGVPTAPDVPTQIIMTSNPNDFAISPDGNTLYLTDGSNLQLSIGGVQRWDKTDGVWNAGPTYILQTPTTTTSGNNGPDGLAVDFSGFTGGGAAGIGAVIYATTGEATANKLLKIVDLGAGSPATVLATAGINQVMRGLRFAPVADAVSIIAQPQEQSAPTDGTANFSVTAAGSAPFSYQWAFEGAPIAGATKSTLTLTGVQAANAGHYSVVVTNDISSITSSNALLTVTAGPPHLQIAQSGGNVIVSWTNAVPGTTYRVQYKSDLANPTWNNLTPDVVPSSSTASKPDTLGAGPRFYRVIVP
jgi:hypothetical protein